LQSYTSFALRRMTFFQLNTPILRLPHNYHKTGRVSRSSSGWREQYRWKDGAALERLCRRNKPKCPAPTLPIKADRRKFGSRPRVHSKPGRPLRPVLRILRRLIFSRRASDVKYNYSVNQASGESLVGTAWEIRAADEIALGGNLVLYYIVEQNAAAVDSRLLGGRYLRNHTHRHSAASPPKW
jgi:hypothetical protein